MLLKVLFAVLAISCVGPVLASDANSVALPASSKAITEFGRLVGSDYRIDIPANWNHELIVFYHGYAVDAVRFPESAPISPMFDPMLAHGYAVIQSAYSQTGWAVEQGFTDTERLRVLFVGKHGKPKRTYVMGMSMGGTLTALTIERSPKVYSGALSLCGAIEPTDQMMQLDFALRAAFDYYFPDLLGPLVPIPDDYRPDDAMVKKIADAMRENPHASQALLSLYGAGTLDDLPPVLAFIGYDIREMQQRVRGHPHGNADLIYIGSGDDSALNVGVKRYRADPKAAQAMARWYTPTGNLTRPMLALHDIGDPLVPASSAFNYAVIAQRAGHGDNFVQQFVDRSGHCVFTPAEVGRAFDELVDWVKSGKRPESGPLK